MPIALITNGTTGIIKTNGTYIPCRCEIISGSTTSITSFINYFGPFAKGTTTCVTDSSISVENNYVIYYDGTVNDYVTYNVYTNLQKAKRLAKPNNKPVRSAIKKGLKLISGLGFDDEIKCFMGGSGIEVSHPDSDFKFVLTKDRSIVNSTRYPGYSTPYKLELYTKTNVFISRLCVYMEGTPVLDQVLGVMMFVKTGDEELILIKANYPGLTSDMKLRDELSIKHPELIEKLRPSFFQNSSKTLNGFVV